MMKEALQLKAVVS